LEVLNQWAFKKGERLVQPITAWFNFDERKQMQLAGDDDRLFLPVSQDFRPEKTWSWLMCTPAGR
jgi:hypothetical protein